MFFRCSLEYCLGLSRLGQGKGSTWFRWQNFGILWLNLKKLTRLLIGDLKNRKLLTRYLKRLTGRLKWFTFFKRPYDMRFSILQDWRMLPWEKRLCPIQSGEMKESGGPNEPYPNTIWAQLTKLDSAKPMSESNSDAIDKVSMETCPRAHVIR